MIDCLDTSFQLDDRAETFHVDVVCCPVSIGMLYVISTCNSPSDQLSSLH